jgi:hypothetical protein
MRAFAFGVAVALLATATSRAAMADATTATATATATATDHAAKYGGGSGSEGDKHGGGKHGGGKNSCSTLSGDCDFLTAGDLESVVTYTEFAVSADDAGALTCTLGDYTPNLQSYACFVDEVTGAVNMGVRCPDGYVVSQSRLLSRRAPARHDLLSLALQSIGSGELGALAEGGGLLCAFLVEGSVNPSSSNLHRTQKEHGRRRGGIREPPAKESARPRPRPRPEPVACTHL